MKKTIVALTVAIAATPAFAKTASVGCTFEPQSTNHSFSLTLNEGQATLKGSFVMPTSRGSYTIAPSRDRKSDLTITVIDPSGDGNMGLQTLTKMDVKYSFPVSKDQKKIQIALTGSNRKLICPIPGRH